MDNLEYKISCHCGAAAQTVTNASGPWPPKAGLTEAGIDLCHCKTCRHTTGILCTSYMLISTPPSLQGLEAYDSSPKVRRYFCGTCGCHVFSFLREGERPFRWAVATGTILERLQDTDDGITDGGLPELGYVRHINIASTNDGGLSPWITNINGTRLQIYKYCGTDEPGAEIAPSEYPSQSTTFDADKAVQAFCHCGNVRFHITRPDNASRIPHSGLTDLIIPFHTGDPRIKNADDRKWWLRPENAANPTHYMAGTCACKSCRLISGFEIQTWAFVPRSNIVFHIPGHIENSTDSEAARNTQLVPLDFASLPPGILRSYESSPGVLRESCVRCGATVFWHDKWRPDLIDVSVGLLDAPEGARAEEWLEWWKGRVSFSEEAGTGRSGDVAARAIDLIGGLEEGLKMSA